MARYHRRGHWRTSKNGTRHWVSGHTVQRSSWGSGWSWLSSPQPARSKSAPAVVHPPAVKWRRIPTEPNSRCPVCGDRVWFFRNEFGGCAYFDALGPPWPKHPCMDLPSDDPMTRQARREAIQAWEKAQRRARAKQARADRKVAKSQARAEQRAAKPTAKQERPRADRRSADNIAEPAAIPMPAETDDSDFPDWLLMLVGLIALIVSLPLSAQAEEWATGRMPMWVFHWLVTTPTLAMLVALVVYLVAVPRPRFTGSTVGHILIGVPMVLVVAVIGNLVTLGFGLPIAAVCILAAIPGARRSAKRLVCDS